MASIAEYFTLRDAAATATRIPDAGRKEIADALSVGRQKAEAAEALWSNGHAAEGLRLAVEALLVTLEAAPRYGRAVGGRAPGARAVPAPLVVPAKTEAEAEAAASEKADSETAEAASTEAASTEAAATEAASTEAAAATGAEAGSSEKTETEGSGAASEGDAAQGAIAAPVEAPVVTWREVLAQRGLAKEKLATIDEAEKKAREASLPKLDADVSPAHSDLYQLLTRARAEVDRALAYAAMSPREIGWTRVVRVATAAILGVLVVVALYFVLRTPTAITAEASETFANSPTFQPQHVVDGDPSTEWILGDRATGWVEARLSPPRRVSRITLTNSRNPPHFDRGTREYRLELYSGGRVVRSIDGEFATFERDPQPVTVEAGVDAVDRVRFVVRSFHNIGGGLAEMQIEE